MRITQVLAIILDLPLTSVLNWANLIDRIKGHTLIIEWKVGTFCKKIQYFGSKIFLANRKVAKRFFF